MENFQPNTTPNASSDVTVDINESKKKKAPVIIGVTIAIVSAIVFICAIIAIILFFTADEDFSLPSLSLFSDDKDDVRPNEETERLNFYDSDGWRYEFILNEYRDVFRRSVYNVNNEIYIRKDITYDTRGMEIKSVDYDANGNVIRSEESEYNSDYRMTMSALYDSNGEIVYKTEYTFDKKGFSTGYIDYAPDGSIEWKTEYKIDDEGNIIHIAYYIRGGILSYERYYDDDGNATLTIYYDDDGNVESRDEYEYDEKGNKVSYKGSALWGEEQTEYEYDAAGYLVFENTRRVFYGEVSTETYKYEYEFDSNGNIIKEIKYSIDDFGNADIVGLIDNEYNAAGNLIKSSEYRNNAIIYEYVYDEDGNEIWYAYYGTEGSSVPVMYSEKGYNALGQRILYKNVDIRNNRSEWQEREYATDRWYLLRTIYYDKDGNIESIDRGAGPMEP